MALLWAACTSEPPRRTSPLHVEAAVDGRPVGGNGGTAVGPLVWGLGAPFAGSTPQDPATPGAGAQDPKTQAPDGTPQGQGDRAQEEARLRLQFGSNVLIGADGRVTKQYFLAGDLGTTFLKLIAEIVPGQQMQPAGVPMPGTMIGGATSQSILGRMLGGREVEVTYIPDFEVLNGARLVDPPQPQLPPAVTGAPLPLDPNPPKVALALITGMPSSLAAFEDALDLFYTSIPQVEITVKVIEYTNNEALAFGVTGIDNTTPDLVNLSSGALVRAYTSTFDLRQPFVGATPVTGLGSFVLGGIHDSWELNVVLQALEANNIADVTSSPKLVVRNGGVASISTLTLVPFPKAKISQFGTEVAVDIEFKPIGVRMNIIPVIAGTDSVILQIYADVSAITGFADTSPVDTPITSNRSASTTVYLKNEHSLLIGGLESKSQFESETKVPLLGDIPILGFLFRSTSKQVSDTNVAFQITPRIVTDRGQPIAR